MSDFQWILAGFDRFSTPGVAVVGIHPDPMGSNGIRDPGSAFSPLTFGDWDADCLYQTLF